jgi:hypothetical protein
VPESQVVLPSHPLDRVAARLAGPRTAADLLGALEMLLHDRAALRAWLRSQVDSAQALDAIVASSYWHANGFAKLVLVDAPGFKIRLHVWPAGRNRRGEPDPHSHRWDFASTVLTGDGLDIVESLALREPRSAADVACTRYVYDGFALVEDDDALKDVYLHDIHAFVVRSGNRYTTETTTIHTVAPKGNDLVATLLVQGPRVSSATAVYGTDLDALVDRPGRLIDATDVHELVLAVVASLDPRG